MLNSSINKIFYYPLKMYAKQISSMKYHSLREEPANYMKDR